MLNEKFWGKYAFDEFKSERHHLIAGFVFCIVIIILILFLIIIF